MHVVEGTSVVDVALAALRQQKCIDDVLVGHWVMFATIALTYLLHFPTLSSSGQAADQAGQRCGGKLSWCTCAQVCEETQNLGQNAPKRSG